jgi:hypothetical protein
MLKKYQGLKGVEEEEFLALINILCDSSNGSTHVCQVTTDCMLEDETMPLDHMHMHQSLSA